MNWFLNTAEIIFLKAGKTLFEIGPYVILGVLISGIIKRTKWKKLIPAINRMPPLLSVPFAVIAGIISPLCTYGTVPIVIRLVKDGVKPAPLITFLAASSMLNPQLFIITWGVVGPEIALSNAGVVFVFGIIFGYLLFLIPPKWYIKNEIILKQKTKECVEEKKHIPVVQFLVDFWNNLQYVGFYFLVGLTLGAAVEVLIPSSLVYSIFKPDSFLSVFFASILSVPLYACGGGTIPFIRSLLVQGMSRGAALAFLFVGPATRITPLMALASAIKPLLLILYVLILILYSLIFGFVLQG